MKDKLNCMMTTKEWVVMLPSHDSNPLGEFWDAWQCCQISSSQKCTTDVQKMLNTNDFNEIEY